MSKHNEALDAVKDDRIATGIHVVATVTMCAKGASKDELELARRILLADPKRDAPREAESIASAFNRVMDAAIESCNESASEPTRAGRRARLAADLDRAGVLIVDRQYLSELIAAKLEPMVAAAARLSCNTADEPESFGAECMGGDWIGGPIGGSMSDAAFIGDVGRDPLQNPSVND